jgi:SPP1 gp7 family putative phage head morphogenesis protein
MLAQHARQHPAAARSGLVVLHGTGPSEADELWYRKRLREQVRRLDAASIEIGYELHATWPRAHDGRVQDADPADVDRLIERAAARIDIALPARRIAAGAVKNSAKTTDARMARAIESALGVDIAPLLDEGALAGAMQRALVANVGLITTIPSRHFAQLRARILETFARGARWETLAEEIRRQTGVTQDRANLIARDQTSKMSAALNEARQTDLGIEEYIWADAGDRRVRPEHHALNGTRQKWAAPPLVEGEHVHPGEAINCRCRSLPVINLRALERRAAA